MQHVRRQTAPDILRLPLPTNEVLRPLDVVGAPIVDGCGQLRLLGKADHVGRLAEGLQPALLANLQRRGRIRMLGHDIAALVKKRLGGIAFLAGIVPAVDEDEFQPRLRIDALHPEQRCIDAHDHFRDRHRTDIANHAALRHFPGDDTLDIAAFIEPNVVGADIRGTLVASRVLEEDLRKALGDFQGGVHVPERGREDQVVSFVGKFRDHPLGVGAFGNVLDIARLDFVSEMRHEFLTSDLVLISPAEVADRPEIDEADLRHGGLGDARETGRRPDSQRRAEHPVELSAIHYTLRNGKTCPRFASRVPLSACGVKAPSESGRRAEPRPRSVVRDRDQHHDRRDVGQCRDELRWNRHAKSL